MPHLIATIDENLINAILAKAGPIEGEESLEASPVIVPYIGIGPKETPLGIKVPFPCRKERTVIPWKVTLKWSVNNLRVELREEMALFKAEVHAESGAFHYTEPLRGECKVTIKNTTVFVTLPPLKVTLYIKPKNTKIDILTFDIVEKLSPELRRMKFDLPFIKTKIEIPLPNSERLILSSKGPDLTVNKGRIVVSANLEAGTD